MRMSPSSRVNPQAKEAISYQKRTVVPIYDVPLQERRRRPLDVRGGGKAVLLDELARKYLHVLGLICQSLQEMSLHRGQRFPKGGVGVAFPLEERIHSLLDEIPRDPGPFLAHLP